MSERMMGLETEHGFSVPGLDLDERDNVLDGLLSTARKKLIQLPDCHGAGMFLENGSRFYIDSGGHPEFCTPEVDNPWDLVCYICAGDLILQRLAAATAAAEGVPEVVFFKCHVDYRNGSTWGCHDNYSHKANANALPAQLLPHLATRMVLAGAGGLNPRCQGVQFVLSPRACHVEVPISHSSTDTRGLYHIKDEPLANGGWSRLHLLSAESAMSHRAMLLKAGSTALVVAMAEGGLAPGDPVRLKSPVDAMHAFNADPAGRVTAPLENGGGMTVLQIQRHYLECAEAHLGHACMPAWAPALCHCWRETLDLLEHGPGAVDRLLDWAIKYSLYNERIRRRGLNPESLAFWNQVLGGFNEEWDEDTEIVRALTASRVLKARDLLRNFEPRLKELGLAWEHVENVLQLRAELCELEARFSQLGPKGIFNSLDRAGLLRHALPEVTPARIETATATPPSRGRAGVRGLLIRKYHGQNRCSADWAGITEPSGRRIHLSDPFLEKVPEPLAPQTPPENDPLAPLLAGVERRYNRGEYEAAWSDLQMLRTLRSRLASGSVDRLLQLTAWVQSRRGHTFDALQALRELSSRHPGNLESTIDSLSVHRFNGLVPQPGSMVECIRLAENFLALPGPHAPPVRFAFLGHKAAMLATTGRLDEARDALLEAIALAHAHNPRSRVLARNLCDLAEIHRLRGDHAGARDCLDRAQAIQTENNYDGDFAEFNLLRRAKIAPERAAAKALLNQARLIQRRLRHRVGMAKTVLLQARLFPSVWHNQRRKRILLAWQREIPMLRECPLMQRIMTHWDRWVGGDDTPGGEFSL